MSELSQRQLEELVNGRPSKGNCEFYEAARLDVFASKEAGRKIYKPRVYVKITQPGVTDWTAELARDHHIKAYPVEYQRFLDNRQGVKKPPIDIIPNLDITHYQELRDMGLVTLEDLAQAAHIPPHLAYSQRAATKLLSVLTETQNDRKESEEIHSEAPEGRDDGYQAKELQPQAEASAAPHRQEHSGDVGRSAVPAGGVSPNFSFSIG